MHVVGNYNYSSYDLIRFLTPLKKKPEYAWLNEVSNATLQHVCQDIGKAYKNCFEGRAHPPKWKSRRKNEPRFPLRGGRDFYFQDGYVKLERIGKVSYRTDYDLPQGRGNGKFLNPRIKLVDGKWILSVGVEVENQSYQLTNHSLGIDLGLKDLAIASCNGEPLVFHNINKSKRIRKLEKKLKHVSRVINRKYRTNGNYEKTKGVLKYERIQAECYRKLRNIRDNYIHQTTHKLVSLLPQRVVMEDLNIKGMMKNKHLSKSIQNACWGKFISYMKYKSEARGIEFLQAPRFYASSKTCSQCGAHKPDLKLSDRTYVCPHCGLVIDRDFNAALNLERYAKPVEGFAA
jgi:putative transposase